MKVANFLLPLCPNRADPNLKNEKEETALHRASYWGELEVVKHLIANGADPKLKDNNGKTAYDHAKEGYYWEEYYKENCKKVMDYLQTLPSNTKALQIEPTLENTKPLNDPGTVSSNTEAAQIEFTIEDVPVFNDLGTAAAANTEAAKIESTIEDVPVLNRTLKSRISKFFRKHFRT